MHVLEQASSKPNKEKGPVVGATKGTGRPREQGDQRCRGTKMQEDLECQQTSETACFKDSNNFTAYVVEAEAARSAREWLAGGLDITTPEQQP